MTSALRLGGGNPKFDDSTDKLRDWDIEKGGGVQKSQNFGDVIYGGWSQGGSEVKWPSVHQSTCGDVAAFPGPRLINLMRGLQSLTVQ